MIRRYSSLILLLFSVCYANADYKILAFGDSNTWGWIPGGDGKRFSDKDVWAGVLESELGAEYTVICDGLVARRTDIDGLDTGLVSGSFFNGAKTLPVAIIRNAPVDLVILFLGTNDLQLGAERSALEIAEAVGGLVDLVSQSERLLYSSYLAPPEVWVIVPPALGDLSKSPLKGLFSVGLEESKGLANAFAEMAKARNLKLFYVDALCPDGLGDDGIHLTKEAHSLLGTALAEAIK